MYRVINHISALRCIDHLQPFTYEWVKSGYVLSLTGQACKIKKTSLKENGLHRNSYPKCIFNAKTP